MYLNEVRNYLMYGNLSCIIIHVHYTHASNVCCRHVHCRYYNGVMWHLSVSILHTNNVHMSCNDVARSETYDVLHMF